MLKVVSSAAVALLALACPAIAQFPAEPLGRKVLESRFGEGVTITYKEVRYLAFAAHTSNADLHFRTVFARLKTVSSHTLVMFISRLGLRT